MLLVVAFLQNANDTFAQSSDQKIIQKVQGDYFLEGQLLDRNDLSFLLSKSEPATKALNEFYNRSISARKISVTGGVIATLGQMMTFYGITRDFYSNSNISSVGALITGAGVFLEVIALAVKIFSYDLRSDAVDVYNYEIIENKGYDYNDRPEVSMGMTPHGIGLVYKF